VPVPAFQAATNSTWLASTPQWVVPADLGTAAPGVDLLAIGRDMARDSFTVEPILLQRDAQQGLRAVHVASAAIPSDSGGRVPTTCGALSVGSPTPDVVALCLHRLSNDATAVYAWRGTIQNRDAAPGSASPPGLPAWTQLASTGLPAAGSFTADMHGATALGLVPAGQTGAGNAVFLVQADKLYVVEVGSDFVAHAFPVTPTISFVAQWGALGRLGGTADFHIAVGGNAGTLVLERRAGAYAWVQKLGSTAWPAAIAPLAAGSPGDVIAFSVTGGIASEYVVLRSDGAGRLR
jgi:hypothetical protein